MQSRHVYRCTVDILDSVGGTTVVDLGDVRPEAGQDLGLVHLDKTSSITIHTTMGYRVTKDGVKVQAPGRLIVKETGQTIGNGEKKLKPAEDQNLLALAGAYTGWSIRLVLERVHTTRSVTGPAKTECGDCVFWDKNEGHRILTELTHKGFREGGYCFPKVVARALAEEAGVPYLDPDLAGFCAKYRALGYPSMSACEEFKPCRPRKGFWAKLFGRKDHA